MACLNVCKLQFLRITTFFGSRAYCSLARLQQNALCYDPRRSSLVNNDRFSLMWIRGMAGHNKWSKIKHKKAANDASRSSAFTKLTRDVTHAVKEGGPDPESNFRLASCISRAKTIDMPKARVEAAIKNALGLNQADATDQILYEGRGPGNSAFLIEVLTSNRNRTRTQIKQILSKNGGSIADPNSVIFQFMRKGSILIDPSVIDPVEPLSKAYELAIEIGVEEVHEVNFQDQKYIQFVCEVSRLNSCTKSLKLMLMEPKSSTLDYLPKSTVSLSESQINCAIKLVDALNDHDDVIHVYENISDAISS